MQPRHARAAGKRSLSGCTLLSVLLALTLGCSPVKLLTGKQQSSVEKKSLHCKYIMKDEKRYEENTNAASINLRKAFWLLLGKKENGRELGAVSVMQKYKQQPRTPVFSAFLFLLNIKFRKVYITVRGKK